MVNAKFFISKENELCGFKILGHAGYDKRNKDIVCAAVSSAAYMTCNMILNILKVKAKVEVNEGYMYLLIPKEDTLICKTILEGFKLHLLELEKTYLRHIKVTKEVVKSDFKD